MLSIFSGKSIQPSNSFPLTLPFATTIGNSQTPHTTNILDNTRILQSISILVDLTNFKGEQNLQYAGLPKDYTSIYMLHKLILLDCFFCALT